MNKLLKSKLFWILFGLFVLRLYLVFVVWHPDVNNHMDWGIRFWEYGPDAFYSANVWSFTWPNQPPGTMYLFAGVRKLFEWVFAFFWWINISVPAFPSGIVSYFETNLYPALLQLPAILADFGIAALIYKFIAEGKTFVSKNVEKIGMTAALVYLVNPVIWYNSSYWGQYDSVVTFLGLAAFYFLLKKKLMPSAIFFALSIYTKISLAIFVPIYAVIVIKQKYSFKEIFNAILMSFGLIYVVTIPFAKGDAFVWLYKLYTNKVLTNQLQVITANAFNLWAAFTGIHEQPHTLMLGPMTYQAWGIILYVVAYIPIIRMVWKKQDARTVVVALSLVAFATFTLLTNMHERYIYPLFPFFTILAVADKKLSKVYWGVTAVALLGMYNFWFTPRIEPLVVIMSAGDRLLPRVLGAVMLGIFLVLYGRLLSPFVKCGK